MQKQVALDQQVFIAQAGKESMFSDPGNHAACSASDDRHASSFCFTGNEVFDAVKERGPNDFDGVKRMCAGFPIGGTPDIRTPLSITCCLRPDGRLEPR